MKKIALATALVIGSAAAAFAEDSSSAFSFNIYPQAGIAQQQRAIEGRNVALTRHPNVTVQSPAYDHASSPYAGGGF